jgi:hypothetical protein
MVSHVRVFPFSERIRSEFIQLRVGTPASKDIRNLELSEHPVVNGKHRARDGGLASKQRRNDETTYDYVRARRWLRRTLRRAAQYFFILADWAFLAAVLIPLRPRRELELVGADAVAIAPGFFGGRPRRFVGPCKTSMALGESVSFCNE